MEFASNRHGEICYDRAVIRSEHRWQFVCNGENSVPVEYKVYTAGAAGCLERGFGESGIFVSEPICEGLFLVGWFCRLRIDALR